MDKQKKLSKEVQEIVKYYGNQNVIIYDELIEVHNNLITELSAYLEDEFLPDFLKKEHALGRQSVQSFLGKKRKGLLPPVLSKFLIEE